MNVYLVHIAPSAETAQRLLEKKFPTNYALHPNVLWAVGTDIETAAAVCQELGLSKKLPTEAPERGWGMVAKLDEYYGMYDTALWQAIDAWRKDP